VSVELHLPSELPVMTLADAVFFPRTIFPLRIFEPRYRAMLRDVLASHRMFGVVNLQSDGGPLLAKDEPPCSFATAGIIHSCHGNPDGTSELLLHGVVRIRILRIVREKPYRVVEVVPVESEPGAPEPDLVLERCQLLSNLATRASLGCSYPEDISSYLESVHDYGLLADIASHLFCHDATIKQKLLETLSVHARLQRLNSHLSKEIGKIRLQKQLQGHLRDEDIGCN
jgi:Lon protease-like protein